MNSNSLLLNLLNKFSHLFHFLNEYTDLKNLWMTAPDLWNSNERRLLCYLELSKSKSIEYWKSKELRAHITSRVSDPGQQISLNLAGCKGITDVSSLGNVHTLNLSRCQGITDVSNLGNVSNLNLERCTGITNKSKHSWKS